MELQYLPHARRRMGQRRVSEAEVEACLQHYDISYQDKKGNPVYIANISGRRIKVIVQKENPLVVITVGD